ncbi:MAG TPA: FCD domain-containing protein [Alphaproteobacteria bacterium]|nr:FCD domain-containing protein [Alphaproteobacteria bacterium]
MTRPEAPSALEIRRTHSLTTLVQDEIERLILSGEIKAGERLNENALATRLGVSRGPVREAARGLEKAGLVRVIVNRGAFVRQISIDEAAELYDLRAALFGMACRRVTEARRREHHDVLADLVSRMERAQRRRDADAYYPLNLEFHQALLKFSGSARLEAMYAGLVKEAHLFRRHALSSAPNMRASNVEHRAILSAIVAGRAADARRLGEQHVLSGKRRFLAAIKSEGQTAAAAALSERS